MSDIELIERFLYDLDTLPYDSLIEDEINEIYIKWQKILKAFKKTNI
jgi:hypothetical protein